jgi:Ca-activated chloride channel family protein
MRFLALHLASWLLALPLAFGAWYLYVHQKRRFRERAAIGPHLQGLSRVSTLKRDAVALVAALLAIVFVTLAMMRPQVVLEQRTPDHERTDVIMVLDRSVSMRARDIRPSRFVRAIQEIRTFLERKPDGIDRVGLVGFAGTALIISHLTRDLNSLMFYLDWIEEDEEVRFETDLGAALASARELARKDRRPTRKFVLVVSDGDDQGTQLDAELAALRAEQTRVYTIGIGSERDVPIPMPAASGGPSFLHDENGNLVTTRFVETTLRRMADQTGGRYFRSASGGELAEAMERVAERERKIVGWTVSTEYRDFYRECLGAAAVALLILLLTL